MRWMVYYESWNCKKITTFNIFDHGSFSEDVKKALKKHNNKEEFAKALKSSLMYYFWSKCEYEIILEPWVGTSMIEGIKIDVYDQVMLNWDVFVDYVWNSKKRRKVEHIEDLSDGALE